MKKTRKALPISDVGKAIQSRLEELGMSQRELSLQIGLNEGTVNTYIKGKSVPSEETAAKIEEALDLEVGEIERLINRVRKDTSHYTQSKKEQEILAAWNRGELTKEQVAEKTGYSLKIVNRYLPV